MYVYVEYVVWVWIVWLYDGYFGDICVTLFLVFEYIPKFVVVWNFVKSSVFGTSYEFMGTIELKVST